jgi:predicted secreted hydrolase
VHQPISLPADDAPHANTYMEWWWWRGLLVTPDGRRYGFMIDLTSKPWANYYALDYGITDLATQTYHYTKEPLVVGRPSRAGAGVAAGGAHAFVAAGGGNDRLEMSVDGYSLALRLAATRPPVFLFGDGYINAYCNTAYFYTRPRMSVTGTLELAGRRTPVTGTAIFDRNWGFDPAQEVAAWDWLNFQLSDGRDIGLVLARLVRGNRTVTVATGLLSGAGPTLHLHPSDLSVTPTSYWQRDRTCRYPVAWNIAVRTGPGRWLHLDTRAMLDDAEMRSLRTPLAYALWPGWPLIWDGPMTVAGDAGGLGWSDLGHYCAA